MSIAKPCHLRLNYQTLLFKCIYTWDLLIEKDMLKWSSEPPSVKYQMSNGGQSRVFCAYELLLYHPTVHFVAYSSIREPILGGNHFWWEKKTTSDKLFIKKICELLLSQVKASRSTECKLSINSFGILFCYFFFRQHQEVVNLHHEKKLSPLDRSIGRNLSSSHYCLHRVSLPIARWHQFQSPPSIVHKVSKRLAI